MPICAGTRCYFRKVDFFFPNWGKHSSVRETKYSVCFFSSPKMQLKQKGSLCVFYLREKKKDKTGSSGKRCVLLSFLCPEMAVDQVNSAVVNEFLVRRPRWCSVLLPYYPSLLACSGCDLLSHAQLREAPVLVASFHSAVL